MQTQLASQKTNLREYIDKIQSLQDEMKKVEELFSGTQEKLERTTYELNWTKQHRDETQELVSKHKEVEEELFGQANELLDTVNETVSDTSYLHSSLNRNKQLHSRNYECINTFKDNAKTRFSKLTNHLQDREEIQKTYHKRINKELGKTFFNNPNIIQGCHATWNILKFSKVITFSSNLLNFSFTNLYGLSCVFFQKFKTPQIFSIF